MPLGVPYYAFIFDLSEFVFFVWIQFYSLISSDFHCVCYHSSLLKKVLKVILIKAQDKHALGNSKIITTLYLWVTPLINPLIFIILFFPFWN